MKEIKFRGKLISNGEWQTGNLISETDGNFVVERTFIHLRLSEVNFKQDSIGSIVCLHEVDRKTVGQYTGLKDKNGKEVYEGDALDVKDEGFPFVKDWIGVVKFIEGSYLIENLEGTDGEYLFDELREIEVIGNIYENPELLEATT